MVNAKQPLPTGVVIGAIVLVILLVGSWYFLSTRGSTEKVDLSKVDMKDEDPPRPGQRGYRERTTDAPL